MPSLQSLIELAAPWASLYNDSSSLSAAVTFFHLGGVLLGGGCAIAADRATLLARSADGASRSLQLDELRSVHRVVLLGLAVSAISGFLMLAADLETFAGSPLFWGKMALIGILMANGWMLTRAETGLRKGAIPVGRGWRRLERAAIASLALWFGALLLGAILTTV